METKVAYRDPTPEELESPLFNAVWNAIKGWDISRTSNGLYSGATGTDVCIVLDAIARHAPATAPASEREAVLEAVRPFLEIDPFCYTVHGDDSCYFCRRDKPHTDGVWSESEWWNEDYHNSDCEGLIAWTAIRALKGKE